MCYPSPQSRDQPLAAFFGLFCGICRKKAEILFDGAAKKGYFSVRVGRAPAKHWPQHPLRLHNQLENMIEFTASPR